MQNKKLLRLMFVVLLVAIMAFTLAACRPEIEGPTTPVTPDNPTPQSSINVATARENVYAALTNHVNVIGDNTAYNLAATLTVTTPTSTTVADISVSVNTAATADTPAEEATKMKIILTTNTTDSDATIVNYVYYADGVFFGTDIGGKHLRINGFDLTAAVNDAVSYLRFGDDRRAVLNSTLYELKSAEGFTYVFNSKITRLLAKFSSEIGDSFGGESVLSDLMGMGDITITEVLAASGEELTAELASDNGVFSPISFTLSGKIANEDYSIRLSNCTVTPSMVAVPNIPSPYTEDYEEFAFATVGVVGSIDISFDKESFTDFTGALSHAGIAMDAFDFSLPITVNAVTESGVTNIYAAITIPEGFLVKSEESCTIEVYYNSEANTIYMDLSAMGMDKFAISLDSEQFEDIILPTGGAGDDLAANLLSAVFANKTSTSDGDVYRLDSEAVGRVFRALGIENFLDIRSAEVKMNLTLGAEELFSSASADIVIGEATRVHVDAPTIVTGFGPSAVKLPVTEDYTFLAAPEGEESSRIISVATLGYVQLPSSVVVGSSSKANDLVESAIQRMFGADISVDGYTDKLYYNFVMEIDLDQLSNSTFFVELSPVEAEFTSSNILLLVEQAENMSYVYSNQNGVYTLASSRNMSELNGTYSVAKIMDYLTDCFGSEDTSVLSFLTTDEGMSVTVQVLLTFLTSVLDNQPALENALITSATMNPLNELTATVAMTKNINVTVYPTSVSLFASPIEFRSTDTYNNPFYVYGGNSVIPDLSYSVYARDDLFVTQRKMAFDSVSVRLTEGTDGGYIVYNVGGKEVAIPADRILNTTVKMDEDGTAAIRPNVGGAVTEKYITVTANSDFLTQTLDEYLAENVQSVRVTLTNDISVDLPIVWDTEYNAAVLSDITSATSETKKYMLRAFISDNLGRAFEQQIELRIEGLSDFTTFDKAQLALAANSSQLEFYAYGGINPTMASEGNRTYYPKYFNVTESKYTNEWDAGSCFILNWDLTAVRAKYQDASFNLADISGDSASVNVSLRATNVFGYHIDITDITVRIYKDIIDAEQVDFSAYAEQFTKGLTLTTVASGTGSQKAIFLNPLQITTLRPDMLSNWATFSCLTGKTPEGVPVRTDKDYQLKWKTDEDGNVLILNTKDYSSAVKTAEALKAASVSITNNGKENCFIFFTFGDTIGKTQVVPVRLDILTRKITDWSIKAPGADGLLTHVFPADATLADLFDLEIPSAVKYLKIGIGGNDYVEVYEDKMSIHISFDGGTQITRVVPKSDPSSVLESFTEEQKAIILAYNDEFRSYLENISFTFADTKRVELGTQTFVVDIVANKTVDVQEYADIFADGSLRAVFALEITDEEGTTVQTFSVLVSFNEANNLVIDGVEIETPVDMTKPEEDLTIAEKVEKRVREIYADCGDEFRLLVGVQDVFDFFTDSKYVDGVEHYFVVRYTLGDYEFDLRVNFTDRAETTQQSDLDYAITDDSFGGVFAADANGNHILTFNPYGDIDYTLTASYPSSIDIIYAKGTSAKATVAYDVEWDISALTNYLSANPAYRGITLAKAKTEGIIVTATIAGITGEGITQDFSMSFDFYVVLTAKIINSDYILYDPDPKLARGFEASNFNDSSFKIMDVTPVTIVNSVITIKDYTRAANYANYVGVSFNEARTDSMWLSVQSWDISAVQAHYNNAPLNEVQSTGARYLSVTAVVGNTYGGYQTIVFNGFVQANADVSINSFVKDPVLLDGTKPYVASVDLDGNTVLTFDPYSVDVANSNNYPRGIKVDVTYQSTTNTSASYNVSWDLAGMQNISYEASTNIVYANIGNVDDNLAIRLPVTVKTREMIVSKVDAQIAQYNISLSPVSTALATGGTVSDLFGDNVQVTAQMENDELWIYYTNKADEFNFENGATHSLTMKFKASVLPNGQSAPFATTNKGNASAIQINEVLVGNQYGGYQYLYRHVDGADVVNIGCVNIDIDYMYVKEIKTVDISPETIYTFDGFNSIFTTLPVTLPESMNVKAILKTGATDVTTNIDVIKAGATSFTKCLGYEWLNKSGTVVDALPYAVRLTTNVPLYTAKDGSGNTTVQYYTFHSDEIIVEESIVNLFKAITEGGIFTAEQIANWLETVKFMWTEGYGATDFTGLYGLLKTALATQLNVDIDAAVAQKYADEDVQTLVHWGRVYCQNSDGVEVKNATKPGTYTMFFEVTESAKYKGTASMTFIVDKKDVYSEFELMANGTGLQNVETYSQIFNGSAFVFTANNISTNPLYSSLVVKARYTPLHGATLVGGEIVNTGVYTVNYDVYNADGVTLNEYYTINQVTEVTISRKDVNAPDVTLIEFNPIPATVAKTADVNTIITSLTIQASNGLNVLLSGATLNGIYTLKRADDGSTITSFANLTPGEEYNVKVEFNSTSNYSGSLDYKIYINID